HRLFVAAELFDAFSRFYVPQVDHLIQASRGHYIAIGREGEAENPSRSLHHAQRLARSRVPEPDCPVPARRSQHLATWRKTYAVPRPAVAIENAVSLAVGRLPDADRLVPASRGNGLAVGCERHRFDGALMAFEDAELLPVGHPPKPDRLVRAARSE